jgi:hypothetical protein
LALAACGGPSNSAGHDRPSPSPSPSPSPTPDVAALASAFTGTYNGSWTNTTFNSTGPVTAVITLNPSDLTVTAALTIGGNVFGGSPPPPETFSGRLVDLSTLGFSGHSPTFGDFTVTSTGSGFVMKAMNLPNQRIDHFEADGTFATGKISGTYTVFFKDGTTAVGNFALAHT